MAQPELNWKEEERVLRAREKLRFRLFAAVREMMLATELFRTHYELHEPEVVVSVFADDVDIVAVLNESQIRLLKGRVGLGELTRFAADVRRGLARCATEAGLEARSDRHGREEPALVALVDAPIGCHAVLGRHERDAVSP